MRNEINRKKKIKKFFEKQLVKLPCGKRIWQLIKALFLLRNKSFRDLFLEVKRNDICLDVGANIGYASLVMWLKGAKHIYSIEPNIEAYNLLKKNLSGINNIYLLNLALSDKRKKEKLYLHESIIDKSDSNKVVEFSQASSLLSDKNNLGKNYYEVDAIKLDQLLADIGKKPNIIKCDIEGGEYIIYKQLIDYAKEPKVRKIFVECHANRYPQYKEMHDKFIKLIIKNNLENKIDTEWH